MKKTLALLLLASLPALAEPPSELDARIGAMQQEFNAHATLLSNRAAALASELAATQAKLKEAQAKECKTVNKEKEKP